MFDFQPGQIWAVTQPVSPNSGFFLWYGFSAYRTHDLKVLEVSEGLVRYIYIEKGTGKIHGEYITSVRDLKKFFSELTCVCTNSASLCSISIC